MIIAELLFLASGLVIFGAVYICTIFIVPNCAQPCVDADKKNDKLSDLTQECHDQVRLLEAHSDNNLAVTAALSVATREITLIASTHEKNIAMLKNKLREVGVTPCDPPSHSSQKQIPASSSTPEPSIAPQQPAANDNTRVIALPTAPLEKSEHSSNPRFFGGTPRVTASLQDTLRRTLDEGAATLEEGEQFNLSAIAELDEANAIIARHQNVRKGN